MKTNIFKLGIIIVCSCFCLQNYAQSSKTSYFMEGSSYRHLMNPALSPTNGYISIPAIGNLYVGLESNLSVTNFLYPANASSNGKLLTFMHPDIDAGTFLNNLANNNNLGANIRTDLLSFGFYAGRSFINFDVALRADVGVNLPKSFFAFLKQGMSEGSGNTYDIKNFNIRANVFSEVALGASTDIFENIRLGVKVKGLVGIAGVNANINQMKVQMSPDEWAITTQATLSGYGKGLILKNDENGYVSGVDFDKSQLGVGGKGFGFDVGVSYSPFKNLTFSVGLIDLGGIVWDKESISQATSSGEVSFAGMEGISIDGTESINDQLTDIQDDLLKMIQFKEVKAGENYYQQLNTTLNIGLEYSVLNNKISAGLLYTNYFNSIENYSECLFSLNLRPLKILQISGSYSFISDYSKSFGVAMKLFNCLYLSWDKVLLNFSPQFIPLDPLSTSIQLGVNIPLNQKTRKTPRMDLSLW